MGYRTIDQAYAYLHELDEGTSITKYFLRMLCKMQKIIVLCIGKKYLINMDSLLDYLKIKGE